MKLTLTIDLDNAAFSFDDDDGPEDGINGSEIARILIDTADLYQACRLGPGRIKLFDVNGNHVGYSNITK